MLTGDTGLERDCMGDLGSEDQMKKFRPGTEILECQVEESRSDPVGNREFHQALEQGNAI